MQSIPVIDLAAGPAPQLVRRVDAAMVEHGFFAVSGHGVPPGAVDAAFDASHRFFALPDDAKARWHIDRSAARRGWDPIGWQSLDVGQPPDVKESFYVGRDTHGQNQWPDDALLPGFRAAVDGYAAAMLALSRRLLALFGAALALPDGHFDAFMRDPICTTRLLHYPPQPADAAPGQIGCGAHTDWGALTLLAQDGAGGLQVQRADGGWIDIAPLAGAFVVNAGDMLQRWTNDRWRSTPHRVINRLGGSDRWSIAYFCDLDADAVIVPLPSCTSAEQPARYAPITPAQHLDAMYRRTTVAAA